MRLYAKKTLLRRKNFMKSQKIISFLDAKEHMIKKEKRQKCEGVVQIKRNLIKNNKFVFIMVLIIFVLYGFFTCFYYLNYQWYPEDWTMTESRKNDKKCKDFRNKYEQKFDSREIRYVSNKCLLSLIDENVDYSEIFYYYIQDDGNASFQATANLKYDNDFLNPLSNGNEESTTYRTVQVNTGYQDIIQDTDIFYRIENGTISNNWYEFYKTILETNYDEYYIDNYFEGFFTNPPECHGVNITFYKQKKCEKITLLISKNVEREDEFHNYIESVAKRKWKIDDKEGPLEYFLKYSFNYPNMSYMIPAEVDEPQIEILDILIYSFRNCYSFDNKEPIVCTSSSVLMMQIFQVFVFYFGVISCIIIPFISFKVGNRKEK